MNSLCFGSFFSIDCVMSNMGNVVHGACVFGDAVIHSSTSNETESNGKCRGEMPSHFELRAKYTYVEEQICQALNAEVTIPANA